ncbi:MAG: UDP-2,3-diacylglucosamine diphosphatase [Bacteroidota bacterium]
MVIQQHLFLSDVHIGAFNGDTDRRLEESLINLLDHAQENQWKIYVLGDLFDYWMEFRNGDRPMLAPRLLDRFAAYNRAMGSTLYITGNHDNWTLGYFEELGFDVESEYRILDFDGKHIFVHHGDGLRNPQFEFPRKPMHRLLRNPLFLNIYRNLLPNKMALRLMQWFSAQSRGEERYNAREIQRHNNWARWALSSLEIDAMIFGHDHLPRRHQVNQKSFVNCGAYYDGRTLASYTNNRLQLVKWNDRRNCLELINDSRTTS